MLDERLVFLLEAIGAHLKPLGWDAGDIFVMSGYRTPYYNKQLDDTKFSLHQRGRASDIFLDKDDNGRMDDFNKDKVISKQDAVALAEVLEVLAKTPELRSFIGGIGIYGSTSAHGPFVHVDTRPGVLAGELTRRLLYVFFLDFSSMIVFVSFVHIGLSTPYRLRHENARLPRR